MCFANYSIMWATKKCSECSWVWLLVSGYSREKGALISQITGVIFILHLQGKSLPLKEQRWA